MIPFILLVVSGACAVAGGAATIEAIDNFSEAKRIVENAKREYEEEYKSLEKDINILNDELERLNKIYMESLQLLREFKSLSERYGVKVKLTKTEAEELKNITFSIEKFIKDFDVAAKILEGGAKAAVKALIAGGEAYIGAVALGTAIGTASTGTAIASLSGAAYTNALLAWFGGGALAAGGGGIALGTAVLGGIVAGPAIAIMGFTLASKAEEALTEAKKFELQVKEEIREIVIRKQEVAYLTRKVYERSVMLSKLNTQFKENIDKVLKSFIDKKEFLMLLTLAKSVRSILGEPLIDKGGERV